MGSPGPFAPVTDAVLARARQDPVFRQQLLAQSLDHLLAGLKRLRTMPDSAPDNAGQVREGAALAVRLAELIQAAGGASPVL